MPIHGDILYGYFQRYPPTSVFVEGLHQLVWRGPATPVGGVPNSPPYNGLAWSVILRRFLMIDKNMEHIIAVHLNVSSYNIRKIDSVSDCD